MTFALFQHRLIESIRARLRNGEITERGFARRLGVSQPHIHNVLKGVRILTPRLADKMMCELGLTLLDLVEAHEMRAAGERMWLQQLDLMAVPLAAGRLGPAEEWPDFNAAREWVPLNRREVAGIADPLLIQLSPDPKSQWRITPNTLALVDKDDEARRNLVAGAWYIIRHGGDGAVAQAERKGERWQVGGLSVPAGRTQHLHLVQAKVVWVGEDPRVACRLSQRGRFLDTTSK